MKKQIGTFKVSCGELRITDPCYNPDTWCTKVVKACDGDWDVEVELNNYNNPYKIKVTHPSAGLAPKKPTCIGYAGVDSGQMGIFDDREYRKVWGKADFADEMKDDWYSKICRLTYHDDISDAGIVGDYGVASSTACGDGSYPVYVRENSQGKAVQVTVIMDI